MSRRPFPNGSGNGTRATDMYTLKVYAPSRDAHQVHDSFRALDRGGNRVRMTHIGFDGMDLSDVAHG